MTVEEQKGLIENYIEAYNSMDIDAMIAFVHPDIVFKNVSGGSKANGMIRLNGRSEFGFRDGKISRITDFS